MLRLVGHVELTWWEPSRQLDAESNFHQTLMLALVILVVPLGQIEANIDDFLPAALICSEISLLVAQKLQSQLEHPLPVLTSVCITKLANFIVQIDVARDDLPRAMRGSPLIQLNVHPRFLRPVVPQALILAIFGTWKHENFVGDGRRRHADRVGAAEASDFLQTLWISNVAVGPEGFQAQFIANCHSTSSYGLFRPLHEARIIPCDHLQLFSLVFISSLLVEHFVFSIIMLFEIFSFFVCSLKIISE